MGDANIIPQNQIKPRLWNTARHSRSVSHTRERPRSTQPPTHTIQNQTDRRVKQEDLWETSKQKKMLPSFNPMVQIFLKRFRWYFAEATNVFTAAFLKWVVPKWLSYFTYEKQIGFEVQYVCLFFGACTNCPLMYLLFECWVQTTISLRLSTKR